MKILLIEDDPASAHAIALALKAASHEVIVASNGNEALQLLALNDIELVITSLVIPNIDGFDLINMIRLKRPKIPVVVVSDDLPRMQEKLFINDPVTFLKKPVSSSALISAVEQLSKSDRAA